MGAQPSQAELYKLDPTDVLTGEQSAKLSGPFIKPLPSFEEMVLGTKAAVTSTAYGNTVGGKASRGGMYADHNGNMYQNTGSGWQKHDNGTWNDANKTTVQQSAQSYEQQHPASANPNDSSYQPKAQSYQQSHPGAEGSYHATGGSSYRDLEQDTQNRDRGDLQSQRFSDYQRSGGWGSAESRWGGSGDRWGGTDRWGGSGGGGWRR